VSGIKPRPSKAVRPTGTLSAEGCSHHRTGRSEERLKNRNTGANLSGPCFLLVSFSSREPRLREAAAHARASPPRGRSDCSFSLTSPAPVIPDLEQSAVEDDRPLSSPRSCSLKEITGSRSSDRPVMTGEGLFTPSPCGSARFCVQQNRQRVSRRPHGRAGGNPKPNTHTVIPGLDRDKRSAVEDDRQAKRRR
jgi:hypothetical protein